MTSSATPESSDEDRISIRLLASDDFQLVVAWLQVEDINRYLVSAWRGGAINSRLLALTMRNPANKLWVIEHEGEPCGLVGLSDIDHVDSCGMVWYLLGRRELGGKGIVSRAVALACKRAFQDVGLRCLYAWVMAPNVSSIRVLQKNGFHEIGRMRQAATLGGEAVDRIYFDHIVGDESRSAS